MRFLFVWAQRVLVFIFYRNVAQPESLSPAIVGKPPAPPVGASEPVINRPALPTVLPAPESRQVKRRRKATNRSTKPVKRSDSPCLSIEEALAKEEGGEFYFRDSILDQLDRYFVYIKRMKHSAKDEYHLYSRVGAHIVPLMATHFLWIRDAEERRQFNAMSEDDRRLYARTRMVQEFRELTPWWRVNRPTFGAIVMAANSYAERTEIEDTGKIRAARGTKWSVWVPKLIYFMKYDSPPIGIQPTSPDDDVYVLSIYWDKPYDEKHTARRKGGTVQEVGIAISPDGNVRALKSLTRSDRSIYCKHGKWRGKIIIPDVCWCHPNEFQQWADDGGRGVSLDVFLKTMFIETATRFERANSGMIRVTARRDGLAAVFSVDSSRLPCFFKDRDVNESGTRRPIFHAVRAHERTFQDGRTTFVRLHFSGERSFSWGNYQIDIAVPGLHHHMPQEIDIGLIDKDQKLEGQRTAGMKKFAETIDASIIRPANPPGISHPVIGQVLPARRAAQDETKCQ